MRTTIPDTVLVTVELFGHARLVCGVKEIAVELPHWSDSSDLASALHSAAPKLRGVVIDEKGQSFLASYTANVNGHCFLDSSPARIAEGDRIYVFSSQAGG